MINIESHSGVYTLTVKQFLPLEKQAAWQFFSSPVNLEKITPDDMEFRITSSQLNGKMYPGQIITYKLVPFTGIKLNWVTEITHVKDGEYFVDEQRFGPYKLWHHKHFFREVDNGIEMTDLVSYKIPFGIIGKIMHGLIIKKKLYKIFTFRYQKLQELFDEQQEEGELKRQ
jgi:ligand-binding SRPBCC domain-containing protein